MFEPTIIMRLDVQYLLLKASSLNMKLLKIVILELTVISRHNVMVLRKYITPLKPYPGL